MAAPTASELDGLCNEAFELAQRYQRDGGDPTALLSSLMAFFPSVQEGRAALEALEEVAAKVNANRMARHG